MSSARPTPFSLVFDALAPERFPPIRASLEAGTVDPHDRDTFLLDRPVVELLRDLRPEEGLGEGMRELAVLLHLAYLFWLDGSRVVSLDEAAFGRLVGRARPPGALTPPARAAYLQVPLRRVWGSPLAGAPAEPLDGWFTAGAGDRLLGAAVFGLHPGRAGFSVVAVDGPDPQVPRRDDGSPLFAPVLAGGAAAGLYSVTDMAELLELLWRGTAYLESSA